MAQPQYSATARGLHWLMAVLILLTIPAGLVMVQDGIDRGLQNALFLYHKNVGVVLLLLVVVRLLWRWRRPPPALPAHLPRWQGRIAGASHAALYLLLVIVPVAGYIRVRAGGFPIEMLDALGLPTLVPRSDALAEVAKSVHYGAGLAIGALIALHVGAALYHGIVKRDGVFARMWPPVGRASH
jgi:cytochrome b561